MEDQPNLRPYGVKGMRADISSISTDNDFWANRARAKLAAFRKNRDSEKPAGRNTVFVWTVFAVCALVASPFVYVIGMLLITPEANLEIAALFAIPPVLLATVFVMVFVRTKPSSPKKALFEYFLAVCRRRHKRARSLILTHDMDGTERQTPHIDGLGKPTGTSYRFDIDGEFKGYWRELVLDQPMAAAGVRISNVQVNNITPDLAIATFRIRMVRNTQLWVFLIFVLGIFALIIMVATNKRTDATITKLLVRVGNEWKLFSGEWQGQDEFDLSWIPDDHMADSNRRNP